MSEVTPDFNDECWDGGEIDVIVLMFFVEIFEEFFEFFVFCECSVLFGVVGFFVFLLVESSHFFSFV